MSPTTEAGSAEKIQVLERLVAVLVVVMAIACGPKTVGPGGSAGGMGGGLSASAGGSATAGGAAGGSAGGAAMAGGSAAGGSTAGGSAGGEVDGGAPTNCVVARSTTCGSDCEARLILPGATDRYCTMQCSTDDECRPYGATLGCSLITGGACTPRCTSHTQCRMAGFGYCDLDGGTCDTFPNCKTTPECVALGFRTCDTQSELCF